MLLLAASAYALTLTLESEEQPYPGITLRSYRTSSPSTNAWVVLVDLCAPDLHVESTYATDTLQTAGAWAEDNGLQLAINGDFYKTGPLRVYGDAIGGGIAWPLDQTGRDPAYSGEWYYDHYGWIGLGFDRVEFTHTGWVKDNAAAQGLSASDGWAPTTLVPEATPGLLSLVSGFPELVVEGVPMICADPEASTCFPDRSDMRDRHPRTAVGIDASRTQLLLAVVDGRTSASDGMYGSELADLMGQLGAYVAFNYDGGGSTELWLEDRGYVNDVSGNNYGSGTRAIANHWGIRAGGGNPDIPTRPGHCEGQAACQLIPPAGGTIDDTSPCFRLHGPMEWWREEADGEGGRLFWTNAWDSDLSLNWAWWQLHLEEAGTYQVEVYTAPGYTAFDDAHYVVVAEDVSSPQRVDLATRSGWWTLGTWDFAAGGDQLVAVYDDAPDGYGANRQILADAIRLTRVGAWCGDGLCDPATESWTSCDADCPAPVDTAPPADTAAPADTSAGGDTGSAPDPSEPRRLPANGFGCGCAHGGSGSGLGGLLALAAIARRRSRE